MYFEQGICGIRYELKGLILRKILKLFIDNDIFSV